MSIMESRYEHSLFAECLIDGDYITQQMMGKFLRLTIMSPNAELQRKRLP
jgi:hypothetical protein